MTSDSGFTDKSDEVVGEHTDAVMSNFTLLKGNLVTKLFDLSPC